MISTCRYISVIDNLSLDKLANMSSHKQFPWKRNEINRFDMLENKLNEEFNQFVSNEHCMVHWMYGSFNPNENKMCIKNTHRNEW
jgi:hypothetical protein